MNERDREGREIGPQQWFCPACRREYLRPPYGAIQCLCYMMDDPQSKTEHCPFKTIHATAKTTKRTM